jgi:hypothetical protein
MEALSGCVDAVRKKASLVDFARLDHRFWRGSGVLPALGP